RLRPIERKIEALQIEDAQLGLLREDVLRSPVALAVQIRIFGQQRRSELRELEVAPPLTGVAAHEVRRRRCAARFLLPLVRLRADETRLVLAELAREHHE